MTAVYISRDLQEKATSDDAIGLYWLAIFLYHVVGFTVVGQTNFNIAGSGMTKGSGTGASINMGSPNQFAVAIPSGQYTLSISDVDRILVIRSTANPRSNTGLFRITSVDTTNNWAYIAYGPSTPTVESGTLKWAVCELETAITFSTGANAGTGYRSNGSATASRIILQSPHSTQWQVRLCRESATDVSNGLPLTSVAPGFGGNSAGDFSVAGEHLHHNLWRNSSNSTYKNTMVGVDRNDNAGFATGAGRVSMWAYDDGSSIAYLGRNAGSLTSGFLVFGIAENEDSPLPPKPVQRLFVIGLFEFYAAASSAEGFSVHFTSDYNNAVASGNGNYGGSAYGMSRQPISCCMSAYAFLTGQSTTNSPRFFVGDNDFTKQTELLTIDVIAGTYDNYADTSNAANSVLSLEVRRIGTLPFIRFGRAIQFWTLTIDKMWYQPMFGVYFPWSGQDVNA